MNPTLANVQGHKNHHTDNEPLELTRDKKLDKTQPCGNCSAFQLPFLSPFVTTYRKHTSWWLESHALISRASKLLWERSAGRRLRGDYFLQRFNTRLKGFPGNGIMHMAVGLRELQWPLLLGGFQFHLCQPSLSLSPSHAV